MTKKQIVILVALVFFVIAGLVFGLVSRKGAIPSDGVGPIKNEGNETDKIAKEFYRSEVPQGAVLSSPKNEIPATANPGLNSKGKFFDLKATQSGFSPNSIIVNRGDTLYIDFMSVDGDYDLAIPYMALYFSVNKKDDLKKIVFDAATPGTFIFQCRDYCPPVGEIKGQLVVLP